MEKIIIYDLADNFIDKLVGFIEENYLNQGVDISKLAFVFGGKRPALFLRKELSGKIKKGFFSPRIFSIDEFIDYALLKKESFSGISDLEACFTIYRLTKDISPDILKGRESFSQFLPWAREILSFIEQLDLEDIDPGVLENIQLKADIGYDVPENINLLLKRIISLRKAYQDSLIKKQTYSRGMVYLLASRYIDKLDFSEFDQILFCGFFYLHKTERKIIKTLYSNGKALLFFQGDEDEWSVLKKVSQDLAISIKPRNLQPHSCDFSIKSGFDIHSQVCLAGDILKRIKDLHKTVIVLPQADNIIPLLLQISAQLQDFNVSIGYPLKRGALYSFFESIFNAQNTRKEEQYYTKDYLRVLSHPLAKNLRLLPDFSLSRIFAHKIEEILTGIEENSIGGSLFIKLSEIEKSRELYDLSLKTMKSMGIEVSRDELKNTLKELHDILFRAFENIKDFSGFSLVLENMLGLLVKKSFLGSYPLDLKMAEKIFSIKEELKILSFNKEPFSGEDIFKIFKNKLDNEFISFSGSPLKGLQILGLFETRSLNFENVIVLDVNEAVLPNLKIYEPLIPREVMIGLGLNRLENEEEIQRYQFRRLISSAKNVYLLYQESSDKEKSRFIEELIWQRQKEQGKLDVLSVSRAGFKVKVLPKHLQISKNEKIIGFLKEREYSVSSVNTYLQCPLSFYYQYVLGVKEKEDLLEEPQARQIGTFIHELFEEAFSGFVGRRPVISKKFREDFFEILNRKFVDQFERKMKSDSFLLKEIIDFRMNLFLDNEATRDVEEIISLEKSFRTAIRVGSNSFKFKAVVDRIDLLGDGTILVIDYKTGGVESIPDTDAGRIEKSSFSREEIKNTVKSFQLPLYLYLIGQEPRFKSAQINACLYSAKETEIKYLFKKEQFSRKEEIMQAYLKALGVIFEEILNPAIHFKADEGDPRLCKNCAFFYLCR